MHAVVSPAPAGELAPNARWQVYVNLRAAPASLRATRHDTALAVAETLVRGGVTS